jgi:hypothetical protein
MSHHLRLIRTFDQHRRWLENINCQNGIAFDLDDVVFKTYINWFHRAEQKFGNPHGLTAEQAFVTGQYLQEYWNFPEAHAFFLDLSVSDDVYDEIEIVEGVIELLHDIAGRVPLVGYFTARPATSFDRTLARLEREGAPMAPLIMRPVEIPLLAGSKWKAAGLRQVFPHVRKFADDNRKLPVYLGSDYRGTVYVIGATEVDHPGMDVRACPTVHALRDHV